MSRLLIAARVSAAAAIVEQRIGGNLTPLPPIGSGRKLSTTTPAAAIKVAKVQTIERARAAAGLSQERLAAEAGISSRWYRDIVKHPSRCSEATIAALTLALRKLNDKARTTDPTVHTALIRASYHGFLMAVCQGLRIDLEAVKADDPKVTRSGDPDWLKRSRARQAAVYLTNQALGIRQAQLARALGLSAPGVCQSLRAVEDLRDDAVFDRVIDAASRIMTNEGL